MNDGIELVKQCVGCGFCCKKAQCCLSFHIYGKANLCPALIWDEDKKRYWCKVCQITGELGAKYKAELCIGEGCSCSLNTDRYNIPPPAKKIKTYSSEIQILIKNLAREFISPDSIWFIIKNTAKDLNDPNFEKQVYHWIREQRSNMVDSMMGKIEHNEKSCHVLEVPKKPKKLKNVLNIK